MSTSTNTFTLSSALLEVTISTTGIIAARYRWKGCDLNQLKGS